MEKVVTGKKDERLVITKIDAARRQLQTAIELFVANGDVVSIHILAMAANEIINTLCEKNGKDTFLKGGIFGLAINEEAAKEFWKEFVKPRNYFKHANKDADETLKFPWRTNEAILFDGVHNYHVLTGGLPNHFHAYKLWYMSKNQRFFNMSGLEEFAEMYAAYSIGQFFQEVCAIIQLRGIHR